MGRYARMLAAGIVLAVLFFILSLASGRFYVPPDEVAAILGSRFRSADHMGPQCTTS